jgi:hypothetical protein
MLKFSHRYLLIIIHVLVFLLSAGQCLANNSQRLVIELNTLSQQPEINGQLDEWNKIGAKIYSLAVKDTSMDFSEKNENALKFWQPNLKVMAGIYDNHIYIAARWQDKSKDDLYRPWKKMGTHIRRGRNKDDMFAIRFQLGESFSSCMLSGKDYETDVWRWSAGRSNLAGIADDMYHHLSPKPLEPAMEYDGKRGLVYFQKRMDAGKGGWKLSKKPKKLKTSSQIAVIPDLKKGSRIDVSAASAWENNYWQLELKRKLTTADPKDIAFTMQQEVVAQIALFNAGYRLRKLTTSPIILKINLISHN